MHMKKSNQDQPQEEIQAESEVLDFTKPDFTFTPAGHHIWVQRGYYLVCKSCELEHGVYIGPNKMLIGENDKGEPILKLRKDLGMV